MVTTTTLEAAVWDALAQVKDPEIPVVSLVDMGMVRGVEANGSDVTVTILPTFTGCPAIAVIEEDVRSAVGTLEGVTGVDVQMSFDPPWTDDRITENGRLLLKDFGLAPPTGSSPVLITEIGLPSVSICPFCGSKNTVNENPFGPTPCRALYYCRSCRQPFEQFKPV